MRKSPVWLALLISLTAFTLAGCGGGGASPQNPFGGEGSLVVFTGDAPLCNVASLEVTLTGATLTPQGAGAGSLTGTPISILSSGQSLTEDFASLTDFSTLLSFTSVPVGTYSQIALTLANPKLTVLDTTKSPPAPTTIATTVSPLTVTFNITPALNVTAPATSASGLQLDFDLRNSVQTDSQGQVTGKVVPVFRARPRTVPSGSGVSDLENLHGVVSILTAGSTNPLFTGSIVVQAPGLNGPASTVNVNNSTAFNGATGLNGILLGTYVEVDASVNSSGNIVANTVQAEEQEVLGQNKAAFVGPIVSIARDSSGNATQFNLFIREENPDTNGAVPTKGLVVVNVSSSTLFKVSAGAPNPDQLQFGRTTAGLGQDVVVHGQFQIGVPPLVNATSVFLRRQSVTGNFSKLLVAGSDGKTGGFVLTPCSGVFQGQSISVLTFSSTSFGGVADLNALTQSPTLVVKGLLFFEPTLTTAGTVTLTPPTLVLVAEEVHQIS